jgi:DNA-binding NarL/FixJ family response regulator
MAKTRVLIADDHRVLRQILIRRLSNRPGIKVIGAAVNGLEAVALSRQLEPDVVVMDVSMPGMDGVEATRRIKAEMPGVRVIAFSLGEKEQITRILEAGAESYVSKSAPVSQLLHAICSPHPDRMDADSA